MVRRMVSACLVGLPCRYDGGAIEDATVIEALRNGEAIPLCPEQLGGLMTPRVPCEIQGGDGNDVWQGTAHVVDCAGNDRTEEFCAGAKIALEFCQREQITEAWLKSRSPSCGCGQIYDGSFTGTLREGDGVTVAALKAAGISVCAFPIEQL